jgi:hypothetical protein
MCSLHSATQGPPHSAQNGGIGAILETVLLLSRLQSERQAKKQEGRLLRFGKSMVAALLLMLIALFDEEPEALGSSHSCVGDDDADRLDNSTATLDRTRNNDPDKPTWLDHAGFYTFVFIASNMVLVLVRDVILPRL